MAIKKASTPKPMEPERARLRLEELCARSEHCEYELRQKLYRWKVSASDSETIMKSLIYRRFVDDRRFTRAFVRDKVQFGRWGRRKIALALAAKRVDRSIVDDALDEIDDQEYEQNLRDILTSKARTIEEPRTYDGRTRLFRFAASRGYEPDLVARIIREVFV